MLVIALTGGIGSGKSTVSELFKLKKIPIVDTDIIARQLVEKNTPAYKKIISIFNSTILDDNKEIDRKILRKLIFSSTEKRQLLESILHPLIWQKVNHEITSLSNISPTPPEYCIVVVPLLVENLTKENPVSIDRILVVDTEETLQIQRTRKRDKCDNSTIKNIIKSQTTREKRIAAADDIIENSGSIKTLKEKVNMLHLQYTSQSKV